MTTFTRGMTLRNTETGDYGIAISSPVEYHTSRQTNISVMIPGASIFSVWHLPDVELADNPYRALSVGDDVLIMGRDGMRYSVRVTYIFRRCNAIVVQWNGREWDYRGPILAAMPASVRQGMR